MNALAPELIEILCCPKRSCRGDLKLENSVLVCSACDDVYPIKSGIPILFPNASHSPDLHQRHWDLADNASNYAKKYDKYLQKQGNAWGQYTHRSELQVIDKLIKKLERPSKIIFDVGCGNGRFLTNYGPAKRKIGLDSSLVLLLAAKEREPDYWFICGQAEDLPLKDAVADLSVTIRVFQHLRAPEAAFAELARVTKPTGHIILELYNKLNLKELYKRFRMLPFMRRYKPWGLTYDRYYSYREINRWSRDNFVTPIAYAGAGWGIHFYLFDLIRFRRLAPESVQRLVFNFYLKLDRWLGDKFFFSQTLEKIAYIGSVTAPRPQADLATRARLKWQRFWGRKKLNKQITILENRNSSLSGSHEQHLRSTISWLRKAQDATPDSGVSRGYSLRADSKFRFIGWQPSYPETTGYIIPTMLRAADYFRDNDLRLRAKRMADWVMAIRDRQGAVPGGHVATSPSRAAIFDTGQVIRGFLAMYQESKDRRYLAAASQSAEWMLAQEAPAGGYWSSHNAKSVNQNTTTYNVYTAAPLAELALLTNNSKLTALARRVADHTVGKQNSRGHFADNCFANRPDPLLHTIGYAIDGLWDLGALLNEDKYQHQARLALDGVISAMSPLGYIPGRLNPEWRGTVNWSCLTGSAQIAVTCLKVYQKTANKKYLAVAEKITDYLKTCQNNYDPSLGGGLGALWGSWPISGEYGQYQSLNWAAKYMADLLMLKLNNNHHEQK